ncbi:cytochrome c-type biogenesis protein [Bartonella sp. LJL80]
MVLAGSITVQAVQPDEVLPDARLEARARDISSHLRCLVCQNESIDDSNAPLARDLRLLVRERLVAGDSNQQVVDFLVARYGEFVLLRPRFNRDTLLLWGAPAFLVIIAGGIICWRVQRRKHKKLMPLNEDEKKRLNALLNGG